MTNPRRKVIIVGGGITGLTSAYYLQKEVRENNLPIDVVLVEASLRVGGKIHTVRKDGFIIERGPESFYDRKGSIRTLAQDLGIEDQLIYNQVGSTYIVEGNQLYPIPNSLMVGATTQASAFLTSGLFTLSGKLRAAGDFILPRSHLESDQPVGKFFRRRFGSEVVENLIEPLLAGTFAGDVEKLSLQSTFPEYFEMEKKYRSLLLGMRKQGARAFVTSKMRHEQAVFQTLKNGLGDLVSTLEANLKPGTIHKGVKVEYIEKQSDGTMSVYFNNIAPLKADAIILAIPFNETKNIFKSELLNNVPSMKAATIATVTMAFKNEQLGDLDAMNLYVSRNSDFTMTSCTYSNRKWPTTAPEGYSLLRTYIGRVGDEAIVELSDSEIEKTVLQDLDKLIHVTGKPFTTVVARWKQAMPQYTVGHVERIEAAKTEIHDHFPNIHLVGSSYEGISIPECVEQGQHVVEKVLEELHICEII